METVAAVLITRDAASTLAATLASVAFCDEVVVLDSGSTDRTREIALAAGARFQVRAFDDFSTQKNQAVSLAGSDWILSIDADETVSAGLADEIRSVAGGGSGRTGRNLNAYRIRRDTVFLGRRLRFGGHQHDRPVRFFRKGTAEFRGAIHEELRTDGRAGELTRGRLDHVSTPDVRTYLRKLAQYTDLEAERLAVSGREPKGRDLLLRPAARFLQKYVLQAGFLDGRGGWEYAWLSAYYEHVRLAKFWHKSGRHLLP